MKIRESRKRMSLDMANDIYECLDAAAAEAGTTNGRYITNLIQLFLSIPDDIKNELNTFCNAKIQELEQRQSSCLEFERNVLREKISRYQQLGYFFSQGIKSVTLIPDVNPMKKIELIDGYVIFPADWIVLDNCDPQRCHYAGVVEVRNGDKYGFTHALFFSDKKYGKDYDDALEKEVYEGCRKVFPRFQEILDAEVDVQYSNGSYGKILNAEEYMRSPRIGLFHILEKNDPDLPDNYDYPYGCMIVRSN